MSTTCVKSFNLNVSPYYYAYFKLDDANGALALTESVSASNLSLSSGVTTSVVGKISTAIALGNLINCQWVNGPNTHWNFSDSFTLRFWIKPETSLGVFVLMANNPGWTVTWFGNTDTLEFLINTASGGTAFVDIGPLAPAVWHEVFFWMQNGVGAGAVLDNGAPVVSLTTDVIKSYPSSTLELFGDHFLSVGFAIDEIAIWKKVLTAAERLADWNGGAGVTYL